MQCGVSHTVETEYNHLHNRGGGYECGVYVCESKDMDEKKHLLKPDIYHSNVEQLKELGETVMNSVSPRMRSLRTNGDGACGMHALFGTPVFSLASNGYELYFSGARELASQHLGPSLEDLEQREQVFRNTCTP